MNRMPPHLGGMPKGTSWTREAAFHAREGARWYLEREFVAALHIIERHSRRPATRDEARRLLAVLEGR